MSEHRGSTDAIHQAKLKSAIQSCFWGVPSAAEGEEAPLRVHTLFVGDRAEIKVAVRGKSGKTVGKVQGTIVRDGFEGRFSVPDGVNEDLYFEAELPKHGLKARSDLLRVVPARRIVNAKWDRQSAKRGEDVKLQAETRGIPDGTRVKLTIYENDADGAHARVTDLSAVVTSRKVEATWAFEYVDDTEDIPSHDEAEKGYVHPEYFFEASDGTVSAKSGLLRFKDQVELRFVDVQGRPFKGMEYELEMPDGTKKQGKLDDGGGFKLDEVPPGAAKLRFPKGLKGIGKGTR